MSYVITVREYGADEVSDVIGPFTTEERAYAWIERYGTLEPRNEYGEPANWYDIFELHVPMLAMQAIDEELGT